MPRPRPPIPPRPPRPNPPPFPPPNRSAEITMRETRRELTYGSTVVLTLSIRRPQVRLRGNPQAESRINRHYEMQASRFMNRATTTLYRMAVQQYRDSQANGFPFHAYDCVMQVTVTYNRNCHLSSYTDQYEYTGGAHGNTLRLSDTFSLRTGARLSLSDFFPRGTNLQRVFLGQILAQAEHNMQQEPGIYFDNYRALIVQYFDSDSYYLSPEGVNIYYQQYQIAPYSTGIVVFTVPYSVLGWRPDCR